MGLQNSLHWLSESESPLLSLHSVIKTAAQRNCLVRPLHQHPHSHRSIYTKVQFCNDTGQIKLLCNLVNGKIELVPRMCPEQYCLQRQPVMKRTPSEGRGSPIISFSSSCYSFEGFLVVLCAVNVPCCYRGFAHDVMCMSLKSCPPYWT